jgi:thiol-disulfide isomerase/thioredoxin
MFTATPEQGIERYAHGATADEIATHISNLYAPFNEADVTEFTTEEAFTDLLDAADTPVVVKFYENWCTHCKALKKPFNIAATKLNGKARWLQVECSKTEASRAFCARYEARAFPVLMAFDSDRNAKFDYEARSVIFLEKFVDAFTAGATGSIGGKAPAQGSTGGSAAPQRPAAAAAAPPTRAAAGAGAVRTLQQSAGSGPSLGVEAACSERVMQLERAVAALTLRLEAVEGRR